tara:strand:+ start:372 stop:629 length:258 start_codon:yes stop_codon:yes gene_type:complete
MKAVAKMNRYRARLHEASLSKASSNAGTDRSADSHLQPWHHFCLGDLSAAQREELERNFNLIDKDGSGGKKKSARCSTPSPKPLL